MSAEQIKMNSDNELKIREMVRAFYEQNPGCEIKIVPIYPDEDEEEDTCICGTEPNKNCDQHSCLNCCEPKASFNDVAWMCAPCQKIIDDEVDAYSDEEDE